MSLTLHQWAWDQPIAKPVTKLTLLALANHAQPDGTSAPGLAALIRDTGAARQTITSALTWLKDNGYIEVHEQRQGKTNRKKVYLFPFTVCQETDSFNPITGKKTHPSVTKTDQETDSLHRVTSKKIYPLNPSIRQESATLNRSENEQNQSVIHDPNIDELNRYNTNQSNQEDQGLTSKDIDRALQLVTLTGEGLATYKQQWINAGISKNQLIEAVQRVQKYKPRGVPIRYLHQAVMQASATSKANHPLTSPTPAYVIDPVPTESLDACMRRLHAMSTYHDRSFSEFMAHYTRQSSAAKPTVSGHGLTLVGNLLNSVIK